MLPIADIIRLSWQTYISKFKKFLPATALIFGASFIGNMGRFFLENAMGAETRAWRIILTGLVSFTMYLISFFITIYLIMITARFLDNKKADINFKKDVLAVFLPAILMSILVGIITTAGFILFIIPGVLFTVWYAFVMYMVILDKKRGLALLGESKKLSAGRFWRVFGRLVVPTLFWGLVSYFVLMGLLNILGMAVNQPIIEETSANVPLSLVIIGLSALVTTFFAPLFMIVNVIVYREVKR
jgi:hypothetical protein